MGSNLLGIHLKDAYRRKFGSIFNIHFLTFIDLSKFLISLWPEAYVNRRPMPLGLDDMFLEKCLATLPQQHPFYMMRQKFGFVKQLKSYFNEMTDESREPEHKYLQKIYRNYQNQYLKDFYSVSDLIAECSKMDLSNILKISSGISTLLCYGFYDYKV